MVTASAAGPQAGPAVATNRLRGRGRALAWGLALAALGLTMVAAMVRLAVGTATGQRLDEYSRWAYLAGQTLKSVLQGGLDVVSVPFLIGGAAVLVAVAIARRRPAAGLAALVLVAGANLATQLAKHELIDRPTLGFGARNTLPSGHVTVLFSLALGAVLVSSVTWRPWLAVAASFVGTTTGVATVLNAWHRPSDVMAAYGVCLAGAGVAVALWALVSRPPQDASSAGRGRRPGRLARYLLGTASSAATVGALLLVAGLGPRPEQAHHAVLGGAMLGLIGLSCALVTALVAMASDSVGSVPPGQAVGPLVADAELKAQ